MSADTDTSVFHGGLVQNDGIVARKLFLRIAYFGKGRLVVDLLLSGKSCCLTYAWVHAVQFLFLLVKEILVIDIQWIVQICVLNCISQSLFVFKHYRIQFLIHHKFLLSRCLFQIICFL